MANPRKLKAKVVDMFDYCANVRKLKLQVEGTLPRFKPGQFLHLSIYDYDPSFNWPESRCFSLANAPNSENEIELVISKKGEYTSKIFDQIKPGDHVWIKLPYGVFNFDDSIKGSSILIAGGTGVSPFISFLRYILTTSLDPKIKLYYGIRDKEVFMIDNLISECISKLENFSYSFFIEQDPGNFNFNYSTGYLDVDGIIEESKLIPDTLYYLSGPPQMIKVFEDKLILNGIDNKNIRFDKWE